MSITNITDIALSDTDSNAQLDFKHLSSAEDFFFI